MTNMVYAFPRPIDTTVRDRQFCGDAADATDAGSVTPSLDGAEAARRPQEPA